MDNNTVQLLTRRPRPDWFAALDGTAGHDFAVADRLLPQAFAILLPRKELGDFRREEFSPAKTYILVDDGWTAQNLKKALAAMKGALFADLAHGRDELLRIIELARSRHVERERLNSLVQKMRARNHEIDQLNRGLEDLVRERTMSESESRRASQDNISRMRGLIGFIKDLSQLFDIADVLPLLRRHLKEHHGLGLPVLLIPRGPRAADVYYFRGAQPVHSRARVDWPSTGRIRVNEPADSAFLANALARPFGKVLQFPLVSLRHQAEPRRAPLLFFEHELAAGDVDRLVPVLAELLQPVSWALDRLVLEQELKSSSRDWEMTFDGLSEPIAILDNDGRVLRANAHWRAEFRQVLQSDSPQFAIGAELYAVEKYPIRMGADSPPMSWVVYLRDETRSRKLKSQVIQVEKMSAIGQLAGHIAHELNNPLTGIRSLSQVLIRDTAEDRQAHKDLIEVEHAAARCQGIINNLLEFSRGGLDAHAGYDDLNDIVRRTLPLLKSAIGRFRNDIDLCDGPLPVRVEPHLMQQVIFNLINNACQAMGEKGAIDVITRAETAAAVLEIRDTGPGIPPELRERIFEPFFTTKADGEGTGLGLSLSRDFVRQFGGDIDVESEPGRGSVFRVRLPLEPRP